MFKRLMQILRGKVRTAPSTPHDQEKTKSSNSESLTKDNSPILSDAEAEESFEDAILAGLDEAVRAKRLRDSKPE